MATRSDSLTTRSDDSSLPAVLRRDESEEPDADEPDTTRLEEDIARTRAEMGQTIEALKDRMRPSALAERATSAVKEATVGKVEDMVHKAEDRLVEKGQQVADVVRHKAVPVALIGIGLAWLLLSRRDERRSRAAHGDGARVRSGGQQHLGSGGQQHLGSGGQQHLRSGGGERLRSRVETAYQESPLVFGAAAFVAGAAVGLAIPGTRKEDQWMGQTRDELVEKVSEKVSERVTEAALTAR